MNRRGFLGAILAAAAAPVVVKAESLMRVKPIVLPGDAEFQDITVTLGDYVDARRDAVAVTRKMLGLARPRLLDGELGQIDSLCIIVPPTSDRIVFRRYGPRVQAPPRILQIQADYLRELT